MPSSAVLCPSQHHRFPSSFGRSLRSQTSPRVVSPSLTSFRDGPSLASALVVQAHFCVTVPQQGTAVSPLFTACACPHFPGHGSMRPSGQHQCGALIFPLFPRPVPPSRSHRPSWLGRCPGREPGMFSQASPKPVPLPWLAHHVPSAAAEGRGCGHPCTRLGQIRVTAEAILAVGVYSIDPNVSIDT